MCVLNLSGYEVAGSPITLKYRKKKELKTVPDFNGVVYVLEEDTVVEVPRSELGPQLDLTRVPIISYINDGSTAYCLLQIGKFLEQNTGFGGGFVLESGDFSGGSPEEKLVQPSFATDGRYLAMRALVLHGSVREILERNVEVDVPPELLASELLNSRVRFESVCNNFTRCRERLVLLVRDLQYEQRGRPSSYTMRTFAVLALTTKLVAAEIERADQIPLDFTLTKEEILAVAEADTAEVTATPKPKLDTPAAESTTAAPAQAEVALAPHAKPTAAQYAALLSNFGGKVVPPKSKDKRQDNR